MKKILTCMLVLVMLFAMTAGMAVSANPDKITVLIDGTAVVFDAEPYIEEGRVLVPFRAIAEALKMNVSWDGETRTVIAMRSDLGIVLQIDNEKAFVNKVNAEGVSETSEIILDVPARIKEDRTYIPLRFFSENVGATVEWNGETRTVTITTVQ